MTEGEEKSVKYEVLIVRSVQKELDRIPIIYYDKLCNCIGLLEENPRTIGSLKLSDKEEYRLRFGPYRILYEIDDKNKTITLYKIAHRKDVYKKK